MSGLAKNEKLLVILLLLAGAFLRLYAPLQYPYTINQDELSNIYDAWSIAETGKDRWESPNPFILRGLGDGDNRPAPLAWLMAGVFKITGYSIAVGRSINAVLGLLSLWIVFLFLKNSYNNTIAIAGLAVGIFSPWHILFSRIALEGAILPFLFLSLVLYCWQKCRADNYTGLKAVFVLGLITGLSANVYQATKLSAFILSLVLAIDVLILAKPKVKPLLVLGGACFLGALPQVFSMLGSSSAAFFARAQTQTIPLNSAESIWVILKNIASNFNPGYLFFSSGVHNNISIYRMYPVELLFFYSGLLLLLLNYKKSFFKFPLVLIAVVGLSAILPAALTYSNPNAIRASGFFIFIVCCVPMGWYYFISFIKNNVAQKWITAFGLMLLIASCGYTAVGYHNSPDLRNRNQQHYLVQLYERLAPVKNNYSKIYIENTTGESYLYLIAYWNIHPRDFIKMEKEYYRATFDDFNRLGNYYFIKQENWKATIDTLPAHEKVLIAAQQKIEHCRVIDSSVFENSVFYFMEPAFHSNSNAE